MLAPVSDRQASPARGLEGLAGITSCDGFPFEAVLIAGMGRTRLSSLYTASHIRPEVSGSESFIIVPEAIQDAARRHEPKCFSIVLAASAARADSGSDFTLAASNTDLEIVATLDTYASPAPNRAGSIHLFLTG